MKEVITLIPLRYNDGTAVPQEEFRRFEQRAMEIAGGYTADGIVEGGWKAEDGTEYIDQSKRYRVAARWWKRPKIKAAVRETGERLDQESMFWQVGQRVGFIRKRK